MAFTSLRPYNDNNESKLKSHDCYQNDLIAFMRGRGVGRLRHGGPIRLRHLAACHHPTKTETNTDRQVIISIAACNVHGHHSAQSKVVSYKKTGNNGLE